MYLVYNHPVTGKSVAKAIDFTTAHETLKILQEMGENDDEAPNLEEAKLTCLPLLVSPFQPKHLIKMLDPIPEEESVEHLGYIKV